VAIHQSCLYRILFEPTITGKMPCVLPEHAFIKVLEGGFAIDVVGNDAGSFVVTTVAGGPFGSPISLHKRQVYPRDTLTEAIGFCHRRSELVRLIL